MQKYTHGSITFSRILFIERTCIDQYDSANFPRKIILVFTKKNYTYKLSQDDFFYSPYKNYISILIIPQCVERFKVIRDTMETNYETSSFRSKDDVRYEIQCFVDEK